MSRGEAPAGQFMQWVGSWAPVIAPATVLSTLLFYFGYVSSRSQYEYFGVDVDTIGLSTQDYIMRSPQPLLVPLLVLTLLAAALLTMDAAVTGRATLGRARSLQRASRALGVAGLAGLAAGVVLLLGYSLARDWAYYNLVTPLLFAFGAGLLAYSSRLSRLVARISAPPAAPPPAAEPPAPPPAAEPPAPRPAAEPPVPPPAAEPPAAAGAPPVPDSGVWLRRAVRTLIYIVLVVGVFWATATIAQWSGRGLARDQVQHLDNLPRVTLDTRERLYLRAPGIEERVLPTAEGQTYHYRYRNLRLLIVGHDRMFLVPEQWSAGNSTLVVPLDDSVRVQFQFQS